MKKAVALPQYSDMRSFSQPSGVVDVQLDKSTNRLATPSCPETYTAAFVAGTEPRETCDQTSGVGGFFSHLLGLGDKPLPPPPQVEQAGADGQPPSEADKKKKGIFGKIVGIFKEDKSSSKPSKPADSGENDPH
jgi:penicillin-binding protein 1B